MQPRIMECRRALNDAGTIYLHCDPTANSYLRLLLDAVFGQKNRMDEIVWHYGTPSADARADASR